MSCTARRRHASTGSKAQFYYHRIYDSSHQQSLECRESRTSSCRMQAVDDPAPVVPDLSDDSSLVRRHTRFFSTFQCARAHFPIYISTHRTHSRATPHCPLINRVTVRRAAWPPARGVAGRTSALSPPRVPLPGSLVRRHDVVHVHPSQARRHHRPVDLPWSALHAALRNGNGALLPASGLLLQPGGER